MRIIDDEVEAAIISGASGRSGFLSCRPCCLQHVSHVGCDRLILATTGEVDARHPWQDSIRYATLLGNLRLWKYQRPYEPLETLTSLNGALYGVFYGGGLGYGGVFKITPAGTVSFVHFFTGSTTEGGHPASSLLAVNGNLYGTIQGQTDALCCVLYEITPSGKDRLLQRADAQFYSPSPLTEFEGALYGSISYVGAGIYGSIFEWSTSGARIVYAFPGGSRGAYPDVLTNANNALYGATALGGDPRCNCGFVFRFGNSGMTILHAFKGAPADASGVGRLLYENGTFYGTSYSGGAHDQGTVFAVDLSGNEHVLYSFRGGADGANPTGDLVDVGGVLYGITYYGGLACNGPFFNACGTIFSVSLTGTESVLHRFNGTDGEYPTGGLSYLNGVFYGSTPQGGSSFSPGVGGGAGVLFSLTT